MHQAQDQEERNNQIEEGGRERGGGIHGILPRVATTCACEAKETHVELREEDHLLHLAFLRHGP